MGGWVDGRENPDLAEIAPAHTAQGAKTFVKEAVLDLRIVRESFHSPLDGL